MITQETAVNVLREFLTAKLKREVSQDEAIAALNALEASYDAFEAIRTENAVRNTRGAYKGHTKWTDTKNS